MASLEIKESEAKEMEEKLLVIAEKLSTVSNGNYVMTSPFTDSQGQSVNALEDVLSELFTCTNIMKDVITNTAIYLSSVIDAFNMIEKKYEKIFNPTAPKSEKPNYDNNK